MIPVWLAYGTLLAGGWRWLELGPDGITPVTPLTGPLRPGRPLADYYGVGMEQWERLRWNTYSPHLDWRGTLQRDGQRLSDLLLALADEGPSCIVAHSRGGLVVRYALANLAAAGRLDAVSRVAFLGTPHHGSLAAMALLAGWDDLAQLLRRLIFGIESIILPPYRGRDLQKAINSWPSIYEMLPDPGWSLWAGVDIATIYDPAAWAQAGLTISADWLAAARQRWGSQPAWPQSVSYLSVIGRGIATALSLEGLRVPISPQECHWTDEGDGTVQVNAAAGPGNNYLITPTSHRALVHDGRVISVVDQWLRTGELRTTAITGPILN